MKKRPTTRSDRDTNRHELQVTLDERTYERDRAFRRIEVLEQRLRFALHELKMALGDSPEARLLYAEIEEVLPQEKPLPPRPSYANEGIWRG